MKLKKAMTSNNRFPNLYIIGVYKGGTTSLHNYLIKHPLISEGSVKETHYLDKFVYKELYTNHIDSEKYKQYFKKSSGAYVLDSSPSYLYGNPELIKFIKSNTAYPKAILILRNPSDRFISYYRYLSSKGIIKESFKDFFEKCLTSYDSEVTLKLGIYNNALKEGLYRNYLKNWVKEFQNNLIILFSEDLKDRPQHEMDKLFSFLNLDHVIYSKQDLTLSNKTINPKSRFIHNSLSSFNLRRVIHPKVYNRLIKIYRGINSQKEIRISDKELKSLDNFYKAPNQELFDYLQIEPRW